MTKTTTPVTDRLVARLIQHGGQGCEENARQALVFCVYGDGFDFAFQLMAGQPRKPYPANVVARYLRECNASTRARCEGDAQALINEMHPLAA